MATQKMTDEQYKQIIHRLNDMAEDINRIDRDLAADRKDLGEMRVDMEAVNQRMKEVGGGIATLQVKTGDAVKDAMEDAVKPMVKTMDKFQSNKTLVIKEIRHSWWPFNRKKVTK